MRPHFEDRDVALFLGDALVVLREMSDGCCDAIVTSPPYLDARPEYPSPTPSQFSSIFRELARVCTGSMLVNVGRLWRERQELLWWVELIQRAVEGGWSHRDTIVWIKQNSNPFQGEIVTNAHEYLFLFGDGFDTDAVRTEYDEVSLARMKRKFVNHAGVKADVSVKDPTEMEIREVNEKGARGKSYFICPTGKEKGNKHPAPMPLELAEYMVRLSCPRRIQYCPSCGIRCDDATSTKEAGQEEGADGAMRTVREHVSSGAEEGQALLHSHLRESESASLFTSSTDDQGLHLDLQAGSPQGIKSGIRDGAPLGDRGTHREDPREQRSRPSQERNQGRQPLGESRTDAKTLARSEAEATSDSNTLPMLRGDADSQRQTRSVCERCGVQLASRPSVVLDPFAGAGTTLLAARRLGREAVGIELSPEYADMCASRLSQQTLAID